MILSGKTAFVSGAGRGIGRSSAVALAQAGADVAVCDLPGSRDAAETLAAVQATGRRGLLVPCDVADNSAVEQAIEQTVREWGKLDLAVACAAFSDRERFWEANLEGFHRTVDVTMWGAFHVVRAAARQMVRQVDSGAAKGCAIVVISSPHAYVAVPRSMAYNMAKAAVDQMVKTAAIELAEKRIRVNLVHPGWTDTPGERKFISEEQLQKAGQKLPWGRLAHPDEIARGVVFLCDPASDYLTGTSLLIDGATTLPWWANRGSAVPE